jgi:hypothetical protein
MSKTTIKTAQDTTSECFSKVKIKKAGFINEEENHMTIIVEGGKLDLFCLEQPEAFWWIIFEYFYEILGIFIRIFIA